MVNGTLQWETPESRFLSCLIVSIYSSQGEYWEECFLLLLVNCNKNNGRDALWCSSMVNSPRLVCFFLNCVYTLHHNDQVNVASASSSIARKKMVEMLYVSPCSKNGFFFAQLILYFLLLNVYHAPRNT